MGALHQPCFSLPRCCYSYIPFSHVHSCFLILRLLEVVKAVLWAPCTAPGNSCFYPPLICLLLLLFWSFWLNWVQNCTAASPSIQFLGWLPPVASRFCPLIALGTYPPPTPYPFPDLLGRSPLHIRWSFLKHCSNHTWSLLETSWGFLLPPQSYPAPQLQLQHFPACLITPCLFHPLSSFSPTPSVCSRLSDASSNSQYAQADCLSPSLVHISSAGSQPGPHGIWHWRWAHSIVQSRVECAGRDIQKHVVCWTVEDCRAGLRQEIDVLQAGYLQLASWLHFQG